MTLTSEQIKDIEIERLQVSVDHHKQVALDYCVDADAALRAENERLKAVVDAVKDVKWRSIDKDNMEFATTCFVVDRIREALAALKGGDGVKCVRCGAYYSIEIGYCTCGGA